MNFQSTSKEVLVNVCDQIVERSSKYLSQRAKSNLIKLITTTELVSMGVLVDILNKESLRLTDRFSHGLAISLRTQNLLYMQSFDEIKKVRLAAMLDEEKWKVSTLEFGIILNKVESLPAMSEAFQMKEELSYAGPSKYN